MSIFISAGHGGTDPGAVANGRREADIAVEFRNMVAFYLRRDGVLFDADGEGSENLPLSKAAAMARSHHVAVEFHCNAAGPTATGVETLSKPASQALGAKLCEAVAGQLGIRNRGAKLDNAGQHSRLAFAEAGGVILELLFITNPADLAAYDARKWLAARAVAEVLINADRGAL